MPAGRPTKYSDDLPQRMLEFCATGFSLTAFAGEIGVSRDTISEWCNVHPEFSAAVSRAKAIRAQWWERQAMKVAENGGMSGQATMVIFGLKNHAPDEFKDKSEVEHTVSEELADFLGGRRKDRFVEDHGLTIEASYSEVERNGK